MKPANITAKQINDLHNDLTGLLHQGIEKAVELGQMLTEKKVELNHGEFIPWINDNLIFTDRTARNYMKLFDNKDKVLQAGSIAEGYNMLTEGKTETVSDMVYSEPVWEVLTKLGEILESIEPGELVTGFNCEPGHEKANQINIRKIDEEHSKYELVYFPTGDDDNGHVSYQDRGLQTSPLMQYLAKHPNLAFENIKWIHPGMGVYI